MTISKLYILTKFSGVSIVFVGGKLFGVMFGDVVSNALGGLVYAVYVVGDWSWAVALVVQTSLLFPVLSTNYKYKIVTPWY